jgi:hypothetical protein
MPSTVKRKVNLEVIREKKNCAHVDVSPSECRTELSYKGTNTPFEYGKIKIFRNKRKK